MTEKELRKKQCCFTGHRTEKLRISEEDVKLLLCKAVNQAVSDGFESFISGMARGVDIWAAETVLDIKKDNPNIRLICAVPYEGFEKAWKEDDKEKYYSILKQADEVVYVCGHYSRYCFQLRNVWMTDHSSRVIAAYTGEKGGTRNTVEYAMKKGLVIHNILI